MASGLFTLKQVNQAVQQGGWSGYSAPKWVEYLVVAGGGGGGTENSGGGGAGGLLTGIATVTAGSSYTITVGAGGVGTSTSTATGSIGSNSAFNTITTLGGGGGGSRFSTTSMSGGSGGGAGQNNGGNSSSPRYGGEGTLNQGNSGGTYLSDSPRWAGAGGGGAGTAGTGSTTSIAGNGGSGISSSITGVIKTYAGGGGGGTRDGLIPGYGGIGGGGTGASSSSATGSNGLVNTGGGAGGGGQGYSGGTGGSGVVVVRYPGNVQFYTGGAITYANGYIVHTFVASGTLVPTTPTVITTDYQISRSLRFNSADSTYLSRTPASAGNRRTWTLSFWIKKTVNGASYTNIFGAGNSASNRADILWHPSDYLRYYDYNNAYSWFAGSSAGGSWNLYRDTSAWYHIVIAVDTTQVNNADRVKGYINGSFVPNGSTDTYTQNAETAINSTIAHTLGSHAVYGQYMNAYLTEVNFIDGQQLAASSFGEFNTNTNVWKPKSYSGTYGTNGFYLNFSDNSSTSSTGIGKDYSGNSNNWTPNNFSVTAGVGNDSVVDVPTSYGTDYGFGGTVRGNYATLNPLNAGNSAFITNGNLDMTANTVAEWRSGVSTIAMSSGKWYAEVTVNNNSMVAGIAKADTNFTGTTTFVGGNSTSWGVLVSTGQVYNNSGIQFNNLSYAAGDVIGFAFDADIGTMTWYKNGVAAGNTVTNLISGPYVFGFSVSSSGSGSINFGQRAWAYTPPAGFKALCTQNLSAPTIGSSPTTLATNYFNSVLYTGNGSARSITGVGFQPDFTWIKARSVAYSHRLADSVRGAGKELYSDDTAAETTNSANGYVTSFNSDGFSLSTGIGVNANTQTFVAWNWKANGSGSTNTAGSITSTVSANSTSGFSVVTYTGNGTSGATVGHGLGVTPSMVILKSRSGGTYDWRVYHSGLTAGYNIALNTAAVQYQGSSGNAGYISAVASTTYTLTQSNANLDAVNASGSTYVAYCFAEVTGYSKFGSYTGNGSADGPFVFCGFRPAYFLARNASGGGNWNLYDNTRGSYNLDTPFLMPNSSAAEYTGGIDLFSNGVKIRTNDSPAGSNVNQSGQTYIFMAFAESPFKYSLAR